MLLGGLSELAAQRQARLIDRSRKSAAMKQKTRWHHSQRVFLDYRLGLTGYRCLTNSNPLGAFISLKSVGRQSGSIRGPAGHNPSCTYSEAAMELSQMKL